LSAMLGTSPLVWFLVPSNSFKRWGCVPSVTGCRVLSVTAIL
jgi:hypothetical protein